MANNYVGTACEVTFPAEDTARAKSVHAEWLKVYEKAMAEDITFLYTSFEVEIFDGILHAYGEEFVDLKALEDFLCFFLNEMGIKEPVEVSWAYTCDKPRAGQFGGGTMIISRNQPTIHVYASTEAWRLYNERAEAFKAKETK